MIVDVLDVIAYGSAAVSTPRRLWMPRHSVVRPHPSPLAPHPSLLNCLSIRPLAFDQGKELPGPE